MISYIPAKFPVWRTKRIPGIDLPVFPEPVIQYSLTYSPCPGKDIEIRSSRIASQCIKVDLCKIFGVFLFPTLDDLFQKSGLFIYNPDKIPRSNCILYPIPYSLKLFLGSSKLHAVPKVPGIKNRTRKPCLSLAFKVSTD